MRKKFIPNNNNNAVCYYRYSSTAQNEASIEQQREAARKYAAEHGYHIIHEYEDPHKTGTNDNRPQFKQMLKDIPYSKPAVLIMWKTDRLARDDDVFYTSKVALREAGVRREYVADINTDDTPAGHFVDHMLEGFATFFSEQLSENIKRGESFNADRAIANGYKILGYKYDAERHYIEDPATAPFVKKIFRDYAAGVPIKAIVDELNGQGLRSSKGHVFTIESIRKILKNDKYLGIYRYGNVEIDGGMPQLISQELFDKVQAQFALNKRGGRPVTEDTTVEDPRYWLTGKLFCAKCKGSMHGHHGTGKSAGKYFYYVCKNAKQHKCSKKLVRKDQIEREVTQILRFLLNGDGNTLQLIEQSIKQYEEAHKDTSYVDSLKASLKDVSQRLGNIMKAIEDGIYTETTKSRLEELEMRQKALMETIEIEEINAKLVHDAGFPDFYKKYLNADLENPELREEILDYFIDKIFVDDDGSLSFVIKRYGKDGTELVEMSAEELIENQGFTVFDNFALCSTQNLADQHLQGFLIPSCL